MGSSIEDYFSSNFVPGTLDKLKRVLRNNPYISGSHEGHSTEIYKQWVTLVFAQGIEELLAMEGSVYDYIVLARERYQAAPTLEQMEDKEFTYEEIDKSDFERVIFRSGAQGVFCTIGDDVYLRYLKKKSGGTEHG